MGWLEDLGQAILSVGAGIVGGITGFAAGGPAGAVAGALAAGATQHEANLAWNEAQSDAVGAAGAAGSLPAVPGGTGTSPATSSSIAVTAAPPAAAGAYAGAYVYRGAYKYTRRPAAAAPPVTDPFAPLGPYVPGQARAEAAERPWWAELGAAAISYFTDGRKVEEIAPPGGVISLPGYGLQEGAYGGQPRDELGVISLGSGY